MTIEIIKSKNATSTIFNLIFFLIFPKQMRNYEKWIAKIQYKFRKRKFFLTFIQKSNLIKKNTTITISNQIVFRTVLLDIIRDVQIIKRC
jgi:hypothetical protein